MLSYSDYNIKFVGKNKKFLVRGFINLFKSIGSVYSRFWPTDSAQHEWKRTTKKGRWKTFRRRFDYRNILTRQLLFKFYFYFCGGIFSNGFAHFVERSFQHESAGIDFLRLQRRERVRTNSRKANKRTRQAQEFFVLYIKTVCTVCYELKLWGW